MRDRTVLIVDDHPIVRQGLRRIIENQPGLAVVGEAGCTRSARDSVERTRPDLVLLDITLEDRDSLQVIRWVREHHPDTSVLVLSMHQAETYADRAIRAGARGYVMKGEPTETLLEAIRRVLDGGIHLDDEAMQHVLARMADGESDPVSRLTDRQLQVFRMLGRGRTTREIAEALDLSVKTVETHRANIMSKLRVRNATELIHRATGWVHRSD